MFIQIDEVTINTDQIIWTEDGNHQNMDTTIVHMTGNKTVELTFVQAKALWKLIIRKDIYDLINDRKN